MQSSRKMDYLGVTFPLFLLVLTVKEGRLLSMLTQGQVSVLDAGDSVELDCEFYTEYFNLFDNPILWKKTQREEETQINIMGNIVEPFVASERFDVTLERTHPRYRLKLEISNLALEDSGNYTCEVRGKRSALLGIVTHYIFVRSPVQNIFISNSNHTTAREGSRIRGLSYVEDRPSTVRCVGVGGYPPPDVEVFLGERHLTEQFHVRHTATLIGSPGLRIMLYTTERWSHNFRAVADDDGASLKCVVSVPGLGSNSSFVTLHVQYAPILLCDPAAAHLGDKNVYLRCEVRAKPGVTALFWAVGNGTTVAPGEIINEQWTLTMVRGEVLETKLFIREAKPESFKKYTLVAENAVATSKEDVNLVRKHRPSTRSPLTDESSDSVQQRSSSSGRRSGAGYSHSPGCSLNMYSKSLVAFIAGFAIYTLIHLRLELLL